MSLIHLVIVLLIVGVLLWITEQAPFVSASVKPIIRWVVIAVVVLWLLTLFIGDIRIPLLRR
jgi:hypothetical protein